MSQTTSENSFSLRNLPIGARLLLTVFLCAAGVSYLAGLNQLHFQHAPAGEPLPDLETTQHVYHGKEGASTLERLITADESKPFTGTGTMKPAFTTQSSRIEREKR